MRAQVTKQHFILKCKGLQKFVFVVNFVPLYLRFVLVFFSVDLINIFIDFTFFFLQLNHSTTIFICTEYKSFVEIQQIIIEGKY